MSSFNMDHFDPNFTLCSKDVLCGFHKAKNFITEYKLMKLFLHDFTYTNRFLKNKTKNNACTSFIEYSNHFDACFFLSLSCLLWFLIFHHSMLLALNLFMLQYLCDKEQKGFFFVVLTIF